MPTFTLNGATYEYLQPGPDGGPAAAHSWEYGSWPRVEVIVPLVDGGAGRHRVPRVPRIPAARPVGE